MNIRRRCFGYVPRERTRTGSLQISFDDYQTEKCKITGDIGGELSQYILSNIKTVHAKPLGDGRVAYVELDVRGARNWCYKDGVYIDVEGYPMDFFHKLPVFSFRVDKISRTYFDINVKTGYPDPEEDNVDEWVTFGNRQLFGVRQSYVHDDMIWSCPNPLHNTTGQFSYFKNLMRQKGEGYIGCTLLWRNVWALLYLMHKGKLDASEYSTSTWNDIVCPPNGIDRLFYSDDMFQEFLDRCYTDRNGILWECDDNDERTRLVAELPHTSGLYHFSIGLLSLGKYFDIVPVDVGEGIGCDAWTNVTNDYARVRANACANKGSADILTLTYDDNTRPDAHMRMCFEGELVKYTDAAAFRELPDRL